MASNDQITNQQDYITKKQQPMYSTELNTVAGVSTDPILTGKDEYQKNIDEANARLQMAGITQAEINAQTSQAETSPGWFEKYIISPLTAPLRFTEGAVLGTTALARDSILHEGAYNSLYGETHKNVFADVWNTAVDAWNKEYLQSGDQRLTGDNLLKFMATGDTDTSDWNFWTKLAVSLPVDILLDPLTYLGAPIFKATAKGIKYGTGETIKIVESLTPTFRTAMKETGLTAKGVRTELNENLIKLAEVRTPNFIEDFDTLMKQKTEMSHRAFKKLNANANAVKLKELQRTLTNADRISELRKLAGPEFASRTVANRAEKELSSSTKLINEFGSLFKKLTGNGEKGGKIVREARNNSLREIRKEQSLMKRLARKYGENTRQITNKILADPNWKHDVELILKASNSKIGEAEIEQIFKDLTSLDKKELVRGKKEIFEALDRMQGNIIGNRVTKTWFEIVADILNTELKGGVGSQNFTLFNLGANDLKTVLDKLAVHSPDDLQALSDIIVREYNPTKFAKYSDLSPFHFNPETTPIDKIIGEGTILSEEQIANLENKLYAIEVKGNTKKNLQIVFNGLKNASKTTAKELEEATAKWNAMWKAGSERQFKQAIEIFANALDLKPGVTSIDTIRQNPEALFNPFLKESLFPDLLDPAQIEFFKEYNPKADEGLKRSLKKAKKKGITITPFLKEQSPYKDKSLITSLKRYGRENNIYKDSFNKWEKIVKEDALTNNEYETFLNELSNIEKNYNKIIASETYKADSKLNEFVSEQYKKVRDFNQKLDVFNSEIKMDKDFLEKYKNYKQVFENFRTEFPELTTEIDKLEKGFEGLYNSFRLTIKEYQNLFRNLSPELKKIVEKIPMDTHSLQELKTTLDQPITKVETVLKQPETKFGQPSGKVEVKPSEKQINTLKQFGVQVPETSREASTMIGALKANGWKTQGLDLKLAPKDLEEKVVNLENKVEELAKKKWTIQDMPDTARNRKILKEDILKETGELTTEDWKVITEESGIPFTSVDDLTKDQLVTLIEDNNFKMSKISKFQKVVKEKDLTYEEAIAKIKERGMVAVDNGMSEKQLKIFTKNKITPVKTSAEASKIIKTIAQKGWRLSEFDVEQINQKIADKALKLTQAEAKKAKQAAKKAAKLEKETTKLANQNVKLQTELEKNAVLPGISDVELQKEMKQLSEDITRMLTKERNPFPEIDSYFKVVDEFKDGGLNSVISLIGDDTLEKLAEKASIENLANIVNDIPKVAKAPEIKKLTASLDNKIREHFGMDKVEWDNLTPKTKGYFIDSLLEEKSNPNVKKILKEVEKQTSKVIEEVKTEVSKIEEAVKVVEEKAASLDDIIKELPKQGEIKFKDLGKKPAQIKKSTKKVEKQVTQIKEEISKIEEPIQEIKKVEYEIKNEISKVEEGLDDIPEDMKQISEEEINAKIKAALNKNKLPQPATKLEQPATKLAQPETKVLSVGEKLKSTLDKKLQEKIDLELEQATKKAEELKKQAAKEIPFGKRPVTKSEKMYIDRVKAYSKKYDIDYQTLFEEAGVDGKTKLSELTHTELGKIVKEYNLNIKSIVQEEDTTGEIVREVVDEEGGLEVDEFDNTEEKASSTSHVDAILELKNKNFDSVDQIRTYAKTNKIPQEDILIEAGIEDKGAFSELTPAETKKLLKFYNPKGAKKTTKAKKVVIDENSPVGKLKAYAAKNNIPAFKMFKDSGINKLTFDSLTPEEITKLSNKYLSGKPLENVEKVVKEENWVTKRIRQYSKDNNVSIDEIFKKVGINTNNFDDLTLDEFDKLADEYLVNDTFLERTRTGKESLNLYNVSKYAKENNITIPTFLKNVGIENKSKLSELTRAEFKKVMDKYNIIKEEPIKAAEEVKKEVSKIEEPLQEVKKEVSKIEEPLQEVKKEITSLDKIIEELPKNDEISKIVEEVRAEVKVVEEQITKIEEAVKEPITKIEEVKPVKRPRVSLENKVREHFGMSESNWDSLTPKMKEDLIGSLSEEDLKNIKKRPTPKKKNLKVDSPEIARLKEFRRLEDMSATDMFRGAGIDKFSFDSLTPDEITKLLNFYDVKVPKVVENVKPIIKETPKAKEEIINIQKELDNISKPIEKITTKIEPTKKVKIGLNEFGLTPPLNKEIPALLENGVLPKNILNDEITRLLKQSDEIKANGGLKVSFLNKFRDITKETLSRKTFLKRNFTEEDLLTMAKELKIPVRELKDVPGNLNYILPEKFSEITGVDYLGKDPKTNSWFFKDKNGKNFRLSGENGSSVKIPLDADQQISERFFTKGMDPEKIKSISTLLKRQGITFKDFSVSDIYDSTYRPKLEEPLKELPKEEVSKIVEPIKEVSNTGEFLKGKDIKSKNKRYTINDFGLEEPLNRELSPLIKPTEIVFNDAEKEKIISKLKEKDFIGEINSYGHYNFNDNFYSELSKKFPDTHQSFRKKLEGQWGEGSTQSLALHWRGGINYLQNWKKIANISDIPVKKYVGELNKMLKFEPERVASALNISYLGKDPETFSFFFTKDGENFSIKFNEVFAGKVPHIQSAERSNIKIPTKFDEIIKNPKGPSYGPQELNVIQGDLVNGVGFLMYEIDDLVKDLNNVGIKVPNVSIEDMFRISYNPTKNEQIFKESANKKILPKQEEVSNKIEPLKEEVQVQDEIPTFKESPIEFNTYPRVEGDKFAFPDRNDLWSNDLAVRRFLDMNQAEWDNITPKMKGGIINNFSEKQLEAIRNSKLFKKVEPLKELPKEEVSKIVEPIKEDVAKLKFTINDDEGMHYRPSAILSSEANKFKSDINFLWNGENVNAKSILSIAKQNIKNGQELEILAKGTDSVNAIKSIEQRLSEESKFFQNISTNLEKGTEVSPTELVDRPINVADYNYSVNEAYNLLNENWKNYEKFIKENNLNGLKGYEILGTEHAKEYSKITSFGDMLQEELEHSLPKIITQNTTKSFLKTVDLDKMSTDELYKIWQKKVEKIPSIKSTHWMHQGDEYRISDKGILSKRAKYSDKYHQIATNKFNSIEDAKTYVNEFFNPIKEEKVLNTTNPEIQLLLDNKDITQKYTKYSKEEWDKFSLEEKNNIINNLSDWEVSKIIESPSFRKIWELANPLPFKSPLNVSNLPELSENQLYNIINDRFKQMYDQYIFMDAKSTPPLLKEYRNILDTFTYDQLNQVSEKLGLGKFFENYSTSGIENYARFNKLNNLENISLNKLFIKNKDKIFEDLKIPKGTSLESLNETQIDQIYKKLDKLLSETEQFKKNIDNLMQGGSRRAAYANFKSSPTHLYVPKELPKDFDTFIKTLKKEAKNWNVKDLEKRYNLKYDSSKKQIPSLEHAKRRNGIGLTFKDKNGNYISIAEDGTATKGGSNGSTIKNFLGKVITLEGDPFFNPGKELPLTFKNKYIKELDQKMNDLFPELNLLKETPKVIEQAPQVINTINEDLLKEIEKFNFKTFNKPTTQTIDKYTAMVSGKQPKTSRNVSIKNEQHLSNDAIKELSDKLNLKINNITSKDVPNFISPETLGDILDLEYLGFSPKQMDWYFKDAENNILRIIKDYKNDWKPLLKGKSLSDFNIPSEFFTKLNVDSNLLPIDYLIRGKSNPLLNNLKDVSYLNEVIGDSVKMNNLDVLDLFNKSYTPKETSKVLDSVKEVLPKAIEDKPVITPDRIKAALARVNKKLNVPEGPKFGIKVPNLSTKPSDFLTKPMIQNKFNVLVDDFINTKTNTAVYLKDKLGNNIRISDKLRNTTFDTPTSPKYKELILPENAFNKKGKMPLINKAYSKDISSFLDNLSPTINQEPIPKIISLSEDVGTKVEEEFITDELPKEIIQAADNGDIPTQVAKDIQKKLPKRLPRDLQKAILEQSNKDIDSFLQSASTADLIDKLGIKNKTKILDKQKIHQEEIGSPTANLTNPEREQFNKFMSDTHGMKLKEKYIQLNPSMRDKLSQEGYLTKVEQANLRKFYQQEYDLAKEFETWIGDPKVFEKIDARFKSTYPKIRAKMNKDLPLSKSELVKLNKFNLDEFNSTKRFEEYIKNADNLKELHKEVFKLNKNIEEKLKLKLPILPEEGKAFQEELYQTFKKLDKKNKMFIFNKPLRVSKTIPQESFNKMESYLNNFYTFGGTSNLEKIAQQKEVMDILNKVGFQEMVSRGRDIANTPLLQLEQLSVSPERTLNEFLYQKGIKNNLLGDREKVYLKNMVTEEVSKVLRGGGTKGKVNDILNREALANKAFATPKYVGTAQGISEKIGFQEFPFFENSLLMRALKTNSEIKNIYKFDKGLIMALKTGAIRTGSSIPDKYAFLYRQIDSSKFNKILESMSKNNPSGFDTYVQLFNKENLHLKLDTSTPGKLIFRGADGLPMMDSINIQRNVDNLLSDSKMSLTNGDLTEIGKGYDAMMRGLKSGMLYSLGYLTRVFFGNITQHILAGGAFREFVRDIERGTKELPKYRNISEDLARARVEARKYLPENTLSRNITDLNNKIVDVNSTLHKQLMDGGFKFNKSFKSMEEVKQVYDNLFEIIELGVLEDVYFGSVRSKLAKAASYGTTSDIKKALNTTFWDQHENIGKMGKMAAKWPVKATIWTTDSTRLGAYLNLLDDPARLSKYGMQLTKKGASDWVKTAYFDIMKLSDFEEKYFARLIPFYRFWRLSVEQNIRNLATLNLEPYRKINKIISEAWLQTGAFDEGGEGFNQIPGFALTQAWMPVHVNEETGKVTTLKYGYTPSTLFNLISNPSSNMAAELFSMGNPIIKAFTEMAFQRNLYTGQTYDKPVEQALNQNLNPFGTRRRSRQASRERATEMGDKNFLLDNLSSIFYSYSTEKQIEYYLQNKISLLNELMRSMEAQGYFIPYFDQVDSAIFKVPELFGSEI